MDLLHLLRDVVFSDEDMVVPDAPFQVKTRIIFDFTVMIKGTGAGD